MKRLFLLLTLCFALFLVGCGVSQSEYDELSKENSSLQAQVEELKSKNQKLEQRIEKLEMEVASSSEDSETEKTTSSDASSVFEEHKKENESAANAPRESEIVAYAETVIKDFYPDSKFPFSAVNDFKVIKTALSYKIEGTFKENKNASYEDFVMIIEFLDESYETYDLISLQVEKEIIYKSQGSDKSKANSAKDNILNEENTRIYNEVMDVMNTEYNRDEDEIIEEMAPKYGMNANELKQFIFDYMEAYYQ